MDVEQIFLGQIEELEKQIAGLKSNLHALRLDKQKLGDPKLRFFNRKPVDAVRKIIEEKGGKIRRSELVDIMVAGGITVGKKRDLKNIRISLDLNIELGNLIQTGDYIDLPPITS
jgi:hypothetical protein